MLYKTIVKASMVGAVLAQPLQHQHHEHKVEKRDVDVVTTTNVVVVTVGAGDATATLPVVSVPTSYGTDAGESAQVVPESVSTTLNTVTTSGTAATSTASTATSSSAAGAKGITYSPYNSDGTCKSTSDVASDLAELSGFDIIRIYGVDCDQVENVLQGKASGQKLFLGIYYVDELSSGISTIASAISSYGSWDDIYTVSIGNELVNSEGYSTSQVQSLVEQAKPLLTAAGYSGPVVAVDTFIAVIENPALCDYSDYIAVNAHAYFDGGVTAQDAGTWVLEQIERVYSACGGSKSVFITETGWPSQGETYGDAVPSKSNQEAAIASIKSACGNDVTLFTAYNDLWKSPGSYGVEQYWGIFSST